MDVQKGTKYARPKRSQSRSSGGKRKGPRRKKREEVAEITKEGGDEELAAREKFGGTKGKNRMQGNLSRGCLRGGAARYQGKVGAYARSGFS